jgi:hypothetical protein
MSALGLAESPEPADRLFIKRVLPSVRYLSVKTNAYESAIVLTYIWFGTLAGEESPNRVRRQPWLYTFDPVCEEI